MEISSFYHEITVEKLSIIYEFGFYIVVIIFFYTL